MLGLKGYSYLWLLIIIIIGAFFFSGGQFITEDLDNLGVIPSTTPTPTGVPFGTGGAGATPWNITVTNLTCTAGTSRITVATTAPAVSHTEFQYVSNPPSTFATSRTDPITPPSVTGDFTLPAPYSNTEWRILLYEGGTKDSAGDYIPGSGTLRFTLPTQDGTLCPTT